MHRLGFFEAANFTRVALRILLLAKLAWRCGHSARSMICDPKQTLHR